MIEIDGSVGEGGGQILRTSLALSLVTQKAFHLRKVRARRPKPGLHPQHLMCVNAAAQIGQAQAEGASLRSTDLVFEPGPVTGGKYHFPIGTAGAVGLVLQTVYLPLALAADSPSEVTLQGGTHVQASPCFHFLDTTWRRYIAMLGIHVSLEMRHPGFYPRGGGLVLAHVQPAKRLAGVRIPERGAVASVTGFSAVAGLPEEIAMRQMRQAKLRLQHTRLKVDIALEGWPGGPGTVIGLVVDSSPVPTLFFGLGARGKLAERVADEACDQVLAYLDRAPAAVDSHSADQLVLPYALASGPSELSVTEVTNHLLTNINVIRRFVDREIVCDGEMGKSGVVRIH